MIHLRGVLEEREGSCVFVGVCTGYLNGNLSKKQLEGTFYLVSEEPCNSLRTVP